MIFATNFVVAGTAIAKAFSNDYGGCKRYPFFATSSIVAKDLSLQFLTTFLTTKKAVAKFSAFLATTLSLLNIYFSQQFKLLQYIIVNLLQ